LSNSKPQHRLLADECVYRATVEFLHGLGYDVVTVQELGLEEAKDVTVIQQAVALERALLTPVLAATLFEGKLAGLRALAEEPGTLKRVRRTAMEALEQLGGESLKR
jgi:hypothetical protein